MAGIDSLAGSLGIQSATGVSLKSEKKEDNLALNFDDYLKLIVAQMQNQDMMNPTDTSDFVNQMVQYTTIQALQEMKELSVSSYAMNFIGKEVVIAETDSNGEITSKKGVVDGVSLYYNEPVFIVDGKEYPMSSIMIASSNKTEQASETVQDTEEIEDI